MRVTNLVLGVAVLSLVGVGCGGDDDKADDDDDVPVEPDAGPTGSLDDYLPELPAPTGDPQSVFAGEITDDSELVPGPAASGLPGDFYIRNARAAFVVQAATRVIGVVPQGGNVVDVALVGSDGKPSTPDQFGELSLVYILGRTCEHQSVEVLQDGSGGGAAVIRARGVSGNNDFINLRGIGVLNVPFDLDPDVDDEVECATTYILEPDSPTLQVRWTLFNGGDLAINGPFGSLSDTGGEIEQWGAYRGFERLGIEALTSAADPAPIPYAVFQGPGVAYGLIPRHADQATTNSTFLIAGVSVILYGAEKLLDIVNPDYFYLHLPPHEGVTHALDLVVGVDAAAVEEQYLLGAGGNPVEVSGSAHWASGPAAQGARVGLYRDANEDGALDVDDIIAAYLDADAEGAFSGRVAPGNYLVRAQVKDLSGSVPTAIEVGASGTTGVAVTLPDPVTYDYTIVDDETGDIVPGKVIVIGRHPAMPDRRLFETYDRVFGIVRQIASIRGTTVDVGDGADAPLRLPAGGTYRIIATRGTEYSIASQVVTAEAGSEPQSIELRLRRVAPAVGYISGDFHIHSQGSPDSPVGYESRIASFVADGVEFLAPTEHDFIHEFQPRIEALGLQRFVRAIPGIEITPFAYGHFNAYPMEVDESDPSGGAVDWGRGTAGFAMLPGEIFDAARDRGARVVEVNHPRSTAANAGFGFQRYFDRAALYFDYDARIVGGDPNQAPVPNDWLRLPEQSLWDDDFNVLEVWNGFNTADVNGDGEVELTQLDVTMKDWFNFLSFGLTYTPVGNSDSHTFVRDPIGMPRSYVRVSDDSADALESGSITDEALATLAGTDGAPRDVVVTDGPMIEVRAAGSEASAIGAVLDGSGGTVTLEIAVTTPDWAQVDTVELFANATPDIEDRETSTLQPLVCASTRAQALLETDVCALASAGGARPLVMELETVGDGYRRYTGSLEVELSASDIVNRAGATGQDAWLVVRVRGNRAIWPIMPSGVLTDDNLDTMVSGSPEEIDAELQGVGVPATAFTAPIYIDFDGGGYAAPFEP